MRDPVRTVRWLVRLYPGTYRAEYGAQIEQTAADLVSGAPNTLARWAVYIDLLIDLPKRAVIAQLEYAGEVMEASAPRYIKRSSLIAIALVVPFFAAIAAQALNHALTGRDLSNSWLWSTPVLTMWVFLLPAAAVLVSLASFLVYTATPARGASRLQRLADVRRTWPVLVPLVIGAGIVFLLLFHDSTHCFAQNPFDSLTHIHQTWRCTTSGFLGGD